MVVMTTPSRMVIWGANDRTTGRGGSGTAGAMKGGVGARGRASRVETASLFAVDRSPRGRVARGSRGVVVASGAGRAMRPTRAWLVAVKRWRLARWSRTPSGPFPRPPHAGLTTSRSVRQLRSVLFNCCDVDSNSHHRAGASASHRFHQQD